MTQCVSFYYKVNACVKPYKKNGMGVTYIVGSLSVAVEVLG